MGIECLLYTYTTILIFEHGFPIQFTQQPFLRVEEPTEVRLWSAEPF